ncbi:MAG: PQQ-binding-like beta-propeller repeat protein [Clostridia bacterium]|nr:PQQ-binding-like beta-propeller repeat protein [Clostridia bacterium]
MDKKDQYIDTDNAYHEPVRNPDQGFTSLVVIVTILMVVLTSVLAIIFYEEKGLPWEKKLVAVGESTVNSQYIIVASPTPSPVQPLQIYQNPLLYPANASVNSKVDPDKIPSSVLPSTRGTTQVIMSGGSTVSEFERANQIYMGDPLDYSSIAGITTFRGNNFRNCASFGYVTSEPNALNQVWEFSGIGTKLSSTMNFEWSGVAWTGQPLIVRWDDTTKYDMNIYESQKAKPGFVEVIVAALDGKIYFFNLEDGSMSRDPINVGASIKGTPAVDPRGYPLIYVGQGDDNGNSGFGMRIYSLIDGSLLYFCDGLDENAYRKNWGACDSSPIVDATSDTLIWPSENGIIYTFQLNSSYNPGSGNVLVAPIMSSYRYIFNDSPGNTLGVESSIAVYGGYAYFCDNNWNLICLDLNTMQMVWQYKLGDDTDVSPVIEEEAGIPYLYVCTEVDGQGDVGQYNGAAYTYKFNGLTGEIVWQTSQACYTYNGETSDSDQSGGCFGNPIVGKKGIANLVIFSYSMTNGLVSGNRLVAYDKITGNQVWEYNMNIYSYSSPVDVYDVDGNGYIIIGDTLGQIHLVDALTGVRIKHIQTSRLIGTADETTNGIVFDASPAVYDGRIIIGTKSGSIFAIDIVHEDVE